jgi:RNA ligase
VFWNPITDERVKIKFEDYKALHKLFTNTNEKAIWEILSEGRDTAEIFAAAPDEFHEWMKGVIRGLKDSYATVETEALFIWRLIQSRLPEGYSRKEFAQMVQTAKREFQGMIFALEDGRSISPTIWKMVKPSGGATMRAVNMDAD